MNHVVANIIEQLNDTHFVFIVVFIEVYEMKDLKLVEAHIDSLTKYNRDHYHHCCLFARFL